MSLSPFYFFACCLLLFSCSFSKKIGKAAEESIIRNDALKAAHVGISVFDPSSGKYLYNFQGDKYFVPASNTKIATCYAMMKVMGDSLPGIYYWDQGNGFIIAPTGDPTFLHPQFGQQKVFDLLRTMQKPIYLDMQAWEAQPWGNGWSWNDYEEPYMAERSALPIYGNVVRFSDSVASIKISPTHFNNYQSESAVNGQPYLSSVRRGLASNSFQLVAGGAKNVVIETSFFTDNGNIIYGLLADTLRKPVVKTMHAPLRTGVKVVYSQHTDSVLRPMMQNSDNFLAEQGLLMVSHQLFGVMNEAKGIDTIVKTHFNGMQQKPRWVDGSGLSRFNLFTPNALVEILEKMQREFGMVRLKEIFPTGNEGTLANYYKADSGFVYAKTGTLSSVVALSGYVYTAKGRMLIFSILVNNHQSSATAVRRAIESFVRQLRSQY